MGLFRRYGNKFQQVADLALQNGAKSGENVCIKAGDFIFIVFSKLCMLHFRSLRQFSLADSFFLNQFSQMVSYCTILRQVPTPFRICL